MCLITNAKETVKVSSPPSLTESTVSSFSSTDSESNGLKVLICSENVPPQVNGIARRIGMYADGLRDIGCEVGELNIHYFKPLMCFILIYLLCFANML
jgi:hypothetical protein